jgi:hypothetical protein
MVDDKSISDFVVDGISPPRKAVPLCKNVVGRKLYPNCRLDRGKHSTLPCDTATILPEKSVDTPRKQDDAKISSTISNNESLGRIKIPLLLLLRG